MSKDDVLEVRCPKCEAYLSEIRESGERKIITKDVKCPVCEHNWKIKYPTMSTHMLSELLKSRSNMDTSYTPA